MAHFRLEPPKPVFLPVDEFARFCQRWMNFLNFAPDLLALAREIFELGEAFLFTLFVGTVEKSPEIFPLRE